MPDKFIAWRNDYNSENYDRYSLMMPKGMKEALKAHISQHGYKSLNDFINRAIVEKIKRDNSSSSQEPEQPEPDAKG